MKIGYSTDKGLRRPKNEDAVKVIPEERFFMLADGVGGNNAGDVASRKSLEALEDYILNNPVDESKGKEAMFRYFEDAVNYVNEVIHLLSEEVDEYDGMATTLVFAYIGSKILYIANIGDSRVYLVHAGVMHQITEDHTYVNDLVKMGAITREEAEHHKKKNVITRAIGENAYSSPDCYNIYIENGDKILICSDGLYDEVSEADIKAEISREIDMDVCADNLVSMAINAGGSDNISVICINMVED